MDSSIKDAGAIKRLRDNGQLNRRALAEISEFTATPDADIFEPSFYVDLVNQAYARDLSATITSADLNPHDPRIVRQVGTYFRSKSIAGGRFNHTGPLPSCCASRRSSSPSSAPPPLTGPKPCSSG